MTNTALYRTRKSNEWITFVECMLKGYSLRKSADIVGVSYVTLFYWRHKLLNGIKQLDYLAWFLFVDNHGHESSRQIIKDMLVTSFSFEVDETYQCIRSRKFAV